MDVSRIFQRCFTKGAMVFQECYKCVEKEVSKVFQACPKGVLKKSFKAGVIIIPFAAIDIATKTGTN